MSPLPLASEQDLKDLTEQYALCSAPERNLLFLLFGESSFGTGVVLREREKRMICAQIFKT
jgi:hypothetical protein